MQHIANFVNSSIVNYSVDSSIIQNVQGILNEELKVDGWISLKLNNREYVVMKFSNGVFMNEGFVLNEEKVLKVLGNVKIGDISYNEESIVEKGIVDLDSGTRFEGRLLIEDKIGIPFGFGEMYDDDGKLMYKGIMINWKRFGYGVNYHDNGEKEYEGYWCNDNRFGNGKVFDRKNRLIRNCAWCYGKESDNYEGDGEAVYLGVTRLSLNSNCKWKVFEISLLESLEYLTIGDDCCSIVKTFRVTGLTKLKSIFIGKNSFTLTKNYYGKIESRSFLISDCENLVSIDIGEYCFSDCSGDFVLQDLPVLKSLRIGSFGDPSYNFYFFSFAAKGYFCFLL